MKVATCFVVIALIISIAGVKRLDAQTASAPPPVAVDSSQQIAARIVNSKKPVLVDFWAPWCGPCRLLNPIIKEIEKEFAGKVDVVKVNVDHHRALAAHFRVSSIPNVFIVKDKAAIASLPGVRPKEEYRQALRSVLGTSAKDSSVAPPAAPSRTGAPRDTL